MISIYKLIELAFFSESASLLVGCLFSLEKCKVQ